MTDTKAEIRALVERLEGRPSWPPLIFALEEFVRGRQAATWDETIEALNWATEHGTDPLAYVAHNNPYRAPVR